RRRRAGADLAREDRRDEDLASRLVVPADLAGRAAEVARAVDRVVFARVADARREGAQAGVEVARREVDVAAGVVVVARRRGAVVRVLAARFAPAQAEGPQAARAVLHADAGLVAAAHARLEVVGGVVDVVVVVEPFDAPQRVQAVLRAQVEDADLLHVLAAR